MGDMTSGRGFAADNRVRVFVSFSRADLGFADQLGAFLHNAGFQPLVDRYENGAEGWQGRIGRLIEEADALVLVLTETSANAELCVWEVEHAQRLNKRVVLVLPAPIVGLARELAGLNTVYFYTDPSIANSGFYDGQRRLETMLRGLERNRAPAEAMRTPSSGPSPQDEARDARRMADLARRQEKKRQKMEQRELERRIRRATGPRFPVLRVAFLGVVAAAVIGVVLKPDLMTQARTTWAAMTSAAEELTAEEEPYSPLDVSVEEYAPERPLYAGRNGANVRDYPLTTGELLLEAPARTPMRVTGRRNVQGQWWFRVVLEDGRVGFVREDVVTFSAPPVVQVVAGVTAITPAVAISAGRAGAKVRIAPRRNATVIVRVAAAAPMQATGKIRQGEHWWLRVTLADGRTGYVRDDVIAADSRTALSL
ncbi:MAG: TIR domain-containing protein [Hyphomonadaceae bacterium]|nr:TIR domain-containing protein [Hyphomonadaceae bacterium]